MEEPTFAPDGTQIAYVHGSGDWGHCVWLVDVDGNNAHEILANETTVAAGHVSGLAWSPAGDRIALALGGTTYTFATEGSSFTRVITLDDDRPYWSPDGSQLAFHRGGLAIADADGSNVLRVGVGAAGPWHPGTPENGAGG